MSTSPTLLAVLAAADVRCHCGDDQHGHRVGAIACDAPTIVRVPVARPALGRSKACRAVGTCPQCGRAGVEVELRTVRTAQDGHPFCPGIPVAKVPSLVAHRIPVRGGKQCNGAGDRPAETRYRFPGLEAMVRDYGPGSVV